jgi:hypothetical protein
VTRVLPHTLISMAGWLTEQERHAMWLKIAATSAILLFVV